MQNVVLKMGDGTPHEIRLGARAMMALEADKGKGMPEILQEFQEKSPTMTDFVGLFAFVINGGKGGTLDEACDVIDGVGFMPAIGKFNEAVELAFPEVSAADEAGGAAAGKKKKAAG